MATENEKPHSGPFLVGAKYSKDKKRALRAMGFKPHEIIFRQCAHCNCKVMIHPNSIEEWKDIQVTLICGVCAKALETTQPQPLFKVITPAAQAIYERAMRHLQSN